MPKQRLGGGLISLDEARRTVETYDTARTRAEAAATLDITERGLCARLKKAQEVYGLVPKPRRSGPLMDGQKPRDEPAIELPHFPDEDISVERLLDMREERFTKRKASYAAHTWFPVKVKDNLPIGLCTFGDPHIDDDGCDLPSLREHARICRDTPGMYGMNIGDTTNNWVGRLARLYAEQDCSVHSARKYAEWFLFDAGIRWLVILLGNHDTWGDGAAVLAQMAKRFGTKNVVMHDWEARFSLAFPNGWAPRIFASHNFKGTSIWNPTHGLIREGKTGDEADLYICGHLHESAEQGFENVSRGRYQRFVRVRGYKFMDKYALHGGFKEQSIGSSCVVIFDPVNRSTMAYMDIAEGAEFLTWKRNRAKK